MISTVEVTLAEDWIAYKGLKRGSIPTKMLQSRILKKDISKSESRKSAYTT
jgi:hypothetical protein